MLPKPPFPHAFIAIEGNIGAGKTTLCELLSTRFECNLLLEQFTDNPFLPFFYEHPERYGFPVELFFMTERHKQLSEHFSNPDLFRTHTFADYCFLKTLLFAKKNLNDNEFRLFQRLFVVLNASFPKPDLLVFLHRPLDLLLKHIHQRGRHMEQQIQEAYLLQIQQAYQEYLKTENETPVLLLELADVDITRDSTTLDAIVSLLSNTYTPGLHHRSI
jgi:deoxyadenosine/deoxycytidine kinase